MIKKKILFIDPVKDKNLLPIFRDLKESQVSVYDCNEKNNWINISTKIGVKCKKLIDEENPFLFPPSKARYHKMGFITRPPNIDVDMEKYGKKIKVTFNKRIF